jgi:hypothetical protein
LFTAPAWAGQVNLLTKTTITTLINTDTGSWANTVTDTVFSTKLNSLTQTQLDTVVLTEVATDTGSILNTSFDTMFKTVDVPGDGILTLIQTHLGTDSGTIANTLSSTLQATAAGTIIYTGIDTLSETLLETDMGTLGNTAITTIIETMIFSGQPADVSIEISQDGLNMTSPFDNSLQAAALVNKVGVAGTRGISQVNAQVGNANVSVASNSLIDGPMLVNFSHDVVSQVALKEIGVLALVPGLALQNSTKATTAHIAGLALAAAESTAQVSSTVLTDTTTDGTTTTVDEDCVACGDDVIAVTVAVDIAHSDLNEYSPHGNVTSVASLVENQVGVRGTTGISQVTAQAGTANVAGSHNVLLIDGTFNANGTALNFNR